MLTSFSRPPNKTSFLVCRPCQSEEAVSVLFCFGVPPHLMFSLCRLPNQPVVQSSGHYLPPTWCWTSSRWDCFSFRFLPLQCLIQSHYLWNRMCYRLSIPFQWEVLKLQSVHIQNMSEGTNSNKMFLKINSHSFSFFCYSVALPHFAPEKRIASGATAAEVSPS